jgi:hypothetical protein
VVLELLMEEIHLEDLEVQEEDLVILEDQGVQVMQEVIPHQKVMLVVVELAHL